MRPSGGEPEEGEVDEDEDEEMDGGTLPSATLAAAPVPPASLAAAAVAVLAPRGAQAEEGEDEEEEMDGGTLVPPPSSRVPPPPPMPPPPFGERRSPLATYEWNELLIRHNPRLQLLTSYSYITTQDYSYLSSPPSAVSLLSLPSCLLSSELIGSDHIRSHIITGTRLTLKRK